MSALESRGVVLGLRIAQILFAIIVLGLAAYVVSWWRHYWHASSPSSLNFLIFDAVWTLLAAAYLIVVPWHFSETRAHHKFAILGVEAVTMLFWFAGFIAAAVFLSGRGCAGGVCRAAEAAVVFAAFEWVLFTITTAMATMFVLRGRGQSRGHTKADPNVAVHEGV
ncbi:membrane-associating domain-containing protein [Neohortaea acidophila]|uniref:Membrane-associating domain-containing protein n=1 Tax=Neohortaea acidophila TaxID=245834 RepID=A0A6A6PFM1_9PEZI|nr:membrane-associating domain-containing protein [Neohortaea acidophila]KAF2478760.1 membrane-associating domain-containing protein [Neohortaea acidophila]